MGTVDDWDEQRSVIGDKGDIGNVDFANDSSYYNYNSMNEGPIIISAPFPLVNRKPRSVIMGETVVDSITIKNTTSDAVDLWSVEIYDSKPKDSFTLSVMQPPSESSDEEYIRAFIESFSLEDRMLRPGQTLTIWLSCKTKVKGLHTSAVHFTVGDETIERMGFVIAEDKISQSLASNKPYSRPRRNKHFVPSVLSVGVNNVSVFVRGSRPAKASTREFRYKLPPYPIPETTRDMIENKCIPDFIIEGLTKNNYVSYFKTLVVMEELKLEEDMRGYDMNCITMKRKGSFLTLEVPGLAERRPSLVIGDYIFAKLASEDGNDTSSAYQGYIHRVEAEDVYLKFDDEFHLSYYGGNLYNVQFAYNRLNMRRLYQAIEAAEKLDTELLFPSESSKKRLIKTTPLMPISCILNEEQMNSVEKILGCKGGPPYVIHGPPGTGKTVTLAEAILQVYTNRKNARILVCAPSNSAADHVLEKILVEKAVEIDRGEIFRLNALTRRVDDIKPDYHEFCYIDEQELVFKCPLFEDFTKYRIIISTYTSASFLYAEGIRRGHFSHIFLDEAGQASEPETMVPLSHLYGRNTVVVLAGDPKQLGPIIFSKSAETYGLGKSYLERLFECNFYGNGDQDYVIKLVRNYRCHPEILHLPSLLFYEGELISCKDEDNSSTATWVNFLPNKEFPMLFTGVQGVDEREGSNPSWFNRIEASEVVDVIIKLTEEGLSQADIGVITPYRQQVLKIQKALEEFVGPEIKVGTVEQFQGQEREVIIISTVRSTIKHNETDRIHCLGFLSNPRRFNVAITRARSLLIVIGNPHIICKDQYWNKLLWRCSDNGSYQGCFLPNKEDIPDVESTKEEYYSYEGQNNFQPSEDQWGYEGTNNFRPSEDVEWGEESFQPGQSPEIPKPEDQRGYEGTNTFTPSENGEWGEEPFQPGQFPEIPKPVWNEDEWSDGWK